MKLAIMYGYLRDYLVTIIRKEELEWDNQDCYKVQIFSKGEAISLYRRKPNFFGRVPEIFLDSTLKLKISYCNFLGYDYYFFVVPNL